MNYFSVLSIFCFFDQIAGLELKQNYDYIIVGGGTVGCVLANRLSADPDVTVLLLEAGPDPKDDSLVSNPRSWRNVFTDPDYDWGYVTEAQPYLASNKGLPWEQGKMLGGSGSQSAIFYTRGSRHDYDRWAELGNKGWGYEDVLHYFKKSQHMFINPEEKHFINKTFHGFNGEMQTKLTHTSPIMKEIIKGGVEFGFEATDYHGEQLTDSISPVQLNGDTKGFRSSTLEAFLRPIMARGNLDIATETFVTKIEVKKSKKSHRAKGVFYMQTGTRHYVAANKEVIISAGTLNTPKLLMLSGIGPKDHLKDLGIKVTSDLPVGNNLENHYAVTLLLDINPYSHVKLEKIHSYEARFEYGFSGKGPWSSPFDKVLSYYRLKNQLPKDLYPYIEQSFFGPFFELAAFPDLRQAIKDKSSISPELLAGLMQSESGINQFSVNVIHLHPRTRGTVRLNSKDPNEKPVINYTYLDNEEDRTDFVAGIRVLQAMANTRAFRDAGMKLNTTPNPNCLDHDFDSDAYWKCYLNYNVLNLHHFTSTCRMNPDSSGVVDDKLRVKGVMGLRVVDASVMPQIVSGHTHAATVMIAEKAADIIKKNEKKPRKGVKGVMDHRVVDVVSQRMTTHAATTMRAEEAAADMIKKNHKKHVKE